MNEWLVDQRMQGAWAKELKLSVLLHYDQILVDKENQCENPILFKDPHNKACS